MLLFLVVPLLMSWRRPLLQDLLVDIGYGWAHAVGLFDPIPLRLPSINKLLLFSGYKFWIFFPYFDPARKLFILPAYLTAGTSFIKLMPHRMTKMIIHTTQWIMWDQFEPLDRLGFAQPLPSSSGSLVRRAAHLAQHHCSSGTTSPGGPKQWPGLVLI